MTGPAETYRSRWSCLDGSWSNAPETRILYCEKKLPTSCLTLALSTWQTIVNNRFQTSQFVYNSCQHRWWDLLVLGLQLLSSDVKSNRKAYWYLHVYFVSETWVFPTAYDAFLYPGLSIYVYYPVCLQAKLGRILVTRPQAKLHLTQLQRDTRCILHFSIQHPRCFHA